MKSVSEIMTADVVWVSPSARVKSAVFLMKGHNISALPVVHADEAVVGLVTEHDLLGVDGDVPVTDVMRTDYVVVDPATSAFDAAEKMNETGSSHLLVMESGRLVGIVSRADVMPEIGRNFDPLTGLQWSDSFRDYATAALKRGQEISVIFFDLDNFRQFNKLHGHVVGDNVIKSVAEALKNAHNPDTDFVCRYGGDEFVIVSTRTAEQALELAEDAQRGVARIKIPEIPEGVSASFGIFGGRRTREREEIHYVATIDDLITRASKNCTEAKLARQGIQAPAAEMREVAAAAAAPAPAPGHRLKIGTVSISTTDTEATVGITLVRGEREFSRQVSGYVIGGTNTLRLIAEAAAGAACKSLASGYGIVVEGTSLHGIGAESEIVSVVATFISPRWSLKHVGSAVVRRGDTYRAAVAALLSSVNRLLENTPESLPEEQEPRG